MSVFDGIKFFCTSTLSDKQKGDLTQLLERNGAESTPLGEATHIIALSLDYEGQQDVKEGSVTVTVRLS
jgi:BRCA1 C Terminus (BRCT) domain